MVIIQHSSIVEKSHSLTLEQFEHALSQAIIAGNPIRLLSMDDIIDALYEVYKAWALPTHPMHQKYRDMGLAYLLSFLHPDSVRKFLVRGLRNVAAMDQISDLQGFYGLAVPKGIVGHWVAGNVPLLSLISVLQAMLTKNISLVKLSTKQQDWITPFLHSLAQTGQAGKIMANAVSVFSFPGEWSEANNLLADFCDVRIAWGGLEAVQAVSQISGKRGNTTISFGPKFSCAMVDPAQMNEESWVKLARDTVLFQQLACTSPHVVVVKGDEAAVEVAAEHMAKAYNKVVDRGYYQPLAAGEAVQVLEYRASAWMNGERILASLGTEWTLHLHQQLAPMSGQGLRIIHLMPCVNWDKVQQYLPNTIQTVIHQLSPTDLTQLVQALQYSGVARFVPVGDAHSYDIPWDGMLVLDQLVRWVRVDGQFA